MINDNPPKLNKIITEAYSCNLKGIKKLLQVINRKNIKKAGLFLFPFVNSNNELDALSKIHFNNILLLSEHLKDSKNLKNRALEIVNSNLNSCQKFQRLIYLQEYAESKNLSVNITLTPYSKTSLKKRLDRKEIQYAYALRQFAKTFPDRNFREWIYKNFLTFHIGATTRLGNNLEIRYPDRIFIGDNCQLNDDITILNESPVIIGNNVMMARGTFISTYYHNWLLGMTQDAVPSWQKGNVEIKPVSIEENVWIGPNCIFESGVYIGHHSIITANSLVQNGIYPPYSFVAGTPAKVIKNIQNQLNKYT